MELKSKLKKITKQKSFNIVLAALLTFTFVCFFEFIGFFDTIESKTIDLRNTMTADYNKADTNIVMVAIDDNSLEFFENNQVSWPWPRQFYGVVVNFLKYSGAKAIMFDIHFSSQEIGRVDVDPEESELYFANSMQNAGNVFLISSLTNKRKDDEIGNHIFDKHLFKMNEKLKLPEFNKADAPINPFQESCSNVGIVTLNADKDNIIRRVPLLYNYNNKAIPQISFLLYQKIMNKNLNDYYSVYKNIPSDGNNNFIIKWYGGGGNTGNVFKYYPISKLIISGYKIEQGVEPEISPSLFKNKVVIIGGTAHGLLDYKPVGIKSDEPYPGMEIHATVLSNLLKKDFIVLNSNFVKIMVLLILSILVPFLFFSIKKIWLSIPIIFVLVLFYFWGSIYIYGKFNYLLSLIVPELTLFFGFLISSVISYMVEGKQKKEIRKTFNRYMSPQVIDEILKNPDDIGLGGKEIEATVFFSDIKDFTSISEKYPPAELVSYLNEYFSQASDIILEHSAMLDKYIGDAIMAIFGAPIYRPDHALAGCLAALQIQEKLNELNAESLKTGKPCFITRIGLNTGKMIVGNIGTSARLDYTAIGDTVNTSSRLEGMNKQYNTRIIISESTYAMVKENVEVRELDFMTVKGKYIPIRIYELLGEKNKTSQIKMDKKNTFEDGLVLYRNRKWTEAINKFEEILKLDNEDLASELYIQRCNIFINDEPPVDWDGVFHAKTK